MKCPNCGAQMQDAYEKYGYECLECGLLVCAKCKTPQKVKDAKPDEYYPDGAHHSTDYCCKKCAAPIYSVDWN